MYMIKILYITAITLSFFIGFTVGIFIKNPSVKKEDSINLTEIYNYEPIEKFIYIAKNNFFVSMKSFFLGLFSLGLFSIVHSFYNGFTLGIVVNKSMQVISINEIIKSTLPHSFEIIGIIIFGYIGFLFSLNIAFRKKLYENKNMIRLFIIASIIILSSAFVEGYISMR